MSVANNGNEVFNIRIVEAAAAEMIGSGSVAPPMTWYDEQALCIRRHVEAGHPIHLWDGCVYGGSGPATHAGSVITSSVEHISMIVLIQLLDPGHPVMPMHFTFPQDMRTGAPAFGSIGCSINNAIFNQVWRKYQIPVASGGVFATTSKLADYQQGYEKALGAIISALSGASVITLQNSISSELSAHPVMAILDDDIAGMVGRFIEGEEVSDETLAIDLIEEVGPIPGFYLNTAHTREWWKKEQFIPQAADYLSYPEWIKRGKKTALDYAKERMEEILATHKPMPLTPDQEQAIEDILEEARGHYKNKGLL
jgi:trimethylamine--corrinoid protein Co-methyltransferase